MTSKVTSKLEVLVDFGIKPDPVLVDKTLNELKSQDHVQKVEYKNGAIMVETTLPSTSVIDMISRASGKRAVLQGFGDTQSAVAMVSSQSSCREQVMGVIRFQQIPDGPLVADGSIDGLPSGMHGLHVHDVGDLSQGCSSIGEHFNPYNSPHGDPRSPKELRHAGDLGNIVADESGRATFRIVDSVLQVWDIIGRSVAVSASEDDLGKGSSVRSKVDGDSGPPIACGVIARSAGVFQNPKRICACDGVVVWDERERPLAGQGRRAEKTCCRREESTNDNGKKTCCKV